MSEIDPAEVPTFPVYVLKMYSDQSFITLDGTQIRVTDGQSPVEAGKTAIQAQLLAHGIDAVRVRAIDEATGDRWNMIISAEGDTLDLTEQERLEEEALAKKNKRRRKLLFAIGGFTALSVITALTVVLWPKPAPAEAPYQPQGVNAVLPVAAPPLYKATATWSQPVFAESTAKQLNDGTLLTVGASGYLETLNPDTGQVTWRGEAAPENVTDVSEMVVAGKPILAYATSTELFLWPREMPSGAASVQPQVIKLEPRQKARVDGVEPFVELGDWYVSVPSDSGMKQVMIPPGTSVATVSSGTITAVSNSKIYTVDLNGKITSERPYQVPKDVLQYPTRIIALDSEHVFASWEGDTKVSGLLNLKTGVIKTAERIRNSTNRTALLIDQNEQVAVRGSIVMIYNDKKPMLQELPSGFKPSAVHDKAVYGTTSKGPAVVPLKEGELEVQPWPYFQRTDPAPFAVTDTAAFLIATQLETSSIYRVDRKDLNHG